MVSGSLTDRCYGPAVFQGSRMLIVCPTCATTYQVAPAALGAGRHVRCAGCMNTWFATAERVLEEVAVGPAVVGAAPAANDFAKAPAEDVLPPTPPVSDNPFAIADVPPLVPLDPAEGADAPAKFDPGVPDQPETEPVAAKRARPARADRTERPGLLGRLFRMPVLIVVMLAILLSPVNWRAAVVRHFPQTASLYGAIGLQVNLRGLFF